MVRAPDVVFDLRYASDHFTGIGTHAHGLATSLLAAPGDERFRILWGPGLPCSRFVLDPFRGHPRVDWIETAAPPLGWRTASTTGALLRRLAARVYLSPFWLMPDRPGMPVVLTLHDVLPLAVPATMPWPRRALHRLALGRAAGAAAVLASSEFTRDEIARLTRIRASRVRVVRLGLTPPAMTAPRRPPGVGEGDFTLVVGVNKPHKNLAMLVEAFRRLPNPIPKLVSAGFEDPRYPGLVALAEGGANVQALGRVSPEDLDWLYRHASLVLFPTRYEGFGLPLLEAAARGAPVVASDIPPLREIGEGFARFVPPEDPGAWAGAIAEGLADERMRCRARESGPALAARFGYATCAAKTLAVLRDAMAARS